MEIVYEMDEYICGVNGQKYEIKGGVPKGSRIERGKEPFRRTYLSSWDSDIDLEGRKVEPPSGSIKRLNEESFLYRRKPDSLRDFENGFGFEHNRFLGSVGGTINLRKKQSLMRKKEVFFHIECLIFNSEPG